MSKNIEIERLRGVAILLVMFTHFWPLSQGVPSLLSNGEAGVDLFFVISGFVVFQSLMRKLPTFSGNGNFIEAFEQSRSGLFYFFKKRFFRIVPTAMLWTIIPLVASMIFRKYLFFGTPGEVIKEIISIFTLQYNYTYAAGGGHSLGVFWSLMVEEHFYIFLPFALLFFRGESQRMVAVIIGILLIAFIIRPMTSGFFGDDETLKNAAMSFTSHRRFDSLFAGVLLAMMRARNWGDGFKKCPERLAQGLVVIWIFALWVFSGSVPSEILQNSGRISLWVIGSALVFFASFEKGFVLSSPLMSRIFAYLGSRSFGLYLCHIPALGFVTVALKHIHRRDLLFERPITFFTVYFVLAIVFSEISFRWVENPLIKYSNKSSI